MINSFSLLSTRHVASDSPAAPWTAACQAPPSLGFPGQVCWSGCHFLLQETFLTLLKPASPALAMSSSSLSHQGSLMNPFSFCLFRRPFLIPSSVLNDGLFSVLGFPCHHFKYAVLLPSDLRSFKCAVLLPSDLRSFS